MAKAASTSLFLFLLSVLLVCSSGSLVGFFYDARKSNAISSAAETMSFLKLNKVFPSQIRVFVEDDSVLDSFSNSHMDVDLYLNETQVKDLRINKHSAISWLKSHLLTSPPHVKIKNIIVSRSSIKLPGRNELPLLLSTLKSIHSIFGNFHLDKEVKVSVALSLSFLENLNKKHERDLHRIFNFINKVGSFVNIEANIDGELSMGDQFIELVIKRATTLATSALPNNIPMVLKIKTSAVPRAKEAAEFSSKISRFLENSTHMIGRKIIELFVEASPIKDFGETESKREEEQIFHSSHRELLKKSQFQKIQHDSIYPPTTTFPTTPITNPTTTPVTLPPDSPSPTIVTVPSTNPVTIVPNPNSNTPVTIPQTTPVPVPYTEPVNSSVPNTNPVTVPGAQPVTNPVTTYPAPPAGGVPATPPATANSPAGPGQRWCVAKSGASETALQGALDYACGIGGADCSVIQQGGSCYNPNSLQNHASYAFNSYYQKNPVQTSCDFGGTAMVTNTNPSTGSCIFPSSSSSPTTTSPMPTPTTTFPPPVPTTFPPPTPTTLFPPPTPATTFPPPTPATTFPPPTPATTSPMPTPPTPTSGTTVPGYGSPPSVLNASNPASGTETVFGDGPTVNTSSTSMSTSMQPVFGCIVLVTSIITGRIVLDM